MDWSIITTVGLFVIGGFVGFLINWNWRLSSQLSDVGRDVANLRAHVAENYAARPEIVRLSEDISQMRQDLAGALALLHELKGQFQNRG
jgi:hypothetical protein